MFEPNQQPEAELEKEGTGFDFNKIEDETLREEVKKEFDTQYARQKHWKTKAIDPATGKPFKTILEESKQVNNQSKTETKTEENTLAPQADARISKLEEAEDKRNFGFTNKLSPIETDELFAYAKGLGVKPSEALERPAFKAMLAGIRETEAASGAALRPSRRSASVEGKSFSQMNEEERAKNFGKVVASFKK